MAADTRRSCGGVTLTRVLVACDEADGLSAATGTLSGIGFEVATTSMAACAKEVAERRPDLLVIDLGNSESRGLRLCEELRGQSLLPVMAVGADDRWLVPALSSGADDYLAKPLDMPTLVAKVLALLRRSGYNAELRRTIKIRDLAIDLDRCQVTMRGQQLSLTPIEYRLLAALARRPGRVLSCTELLKEAQGYDVDEQEARDIIKVHIYHLRRKLEPSDTKGEYVVTVPGFGYMLERRASPQPPVLQAGWARRGLVRDQQGGLPSEAAGGNGLRPLEAAH